MGTANTHTHSLTYTTRACTSTRLPTLPPTHTHTHPGFGEKEGDSTGIHSIKLEITTLIENKKMEKKKRKEKKEAVIALHTLDIRIHSH